jgi:hypothetical protein
MTMYSSCDDPNGPGFPIRKSADQSLLAAPRSLSQPITSFIASWRQGIHQMPFLCLISQSNLSRTGTNPEHDRLRLIQVLPQSLLHNKLEPESRGGDKSPSYSRVILHIPCLSGPLKDAVVWGRRIPFRPGPHSLRGIKRSFDRLMVEPDGIEPTTSCLQSRRSPN